jgi:hypothetical protein
MPKTVRALALVVCLLVAAPAFPGQAYSNADLKELSTYTLTLDGIYKVNRVMMNVVTEMKKDPKVVQLIKIQGEIEALKKKDERTDAEDEKLQALEAQKEQIDSQIDNPLTINDVGTLNDWAAKLQKDRIVSAALQKEGMTATAFSRAFAGLLQAGLAAGLQKAGIKQIPEGTNPANVKLVIDHEAELQKMQQAWGDAGK